MRKPDYKKFHEGCLQAWTMFNVTNERVIPEESYKEFHMPKCAFEFYEPLFDLICEPTEEFTKTLRDKISDYNKKMRESKSNTEAIEEENTEITQEELIEQCIAILKATGDYVIKKRVVTVTYEEV